MRQHHWPAWAHRHLTRRLTRHSTCSATSAGSAYDEFDSTGLRHLRGVIAAHGRTIPFENLDPLLGIPVADLSAAALSDKLVSRRRGGYCYEHNGLLGYALDELGYGVERLAGRVVWMQGTRRPLPALTHNVLAVMVPGRPGGIWSTSASAGRRCRRRSGCRPVRCSRPATSPTGCCSCPPATSLSTNWPRRSAVEWQPLYRFTAVPQPRIDLEVGSWYVSTHPGGVFVVGLSAALVTDDARINLRGRNLAIHSHGETERIRFGTAAEVLDALTGRFGVNLSDLDGVDVEARVAQVLDS